MLRMIDSNAECRFITLTLRHTDALLDVQIRRLTSCFKDLRSHPDVGPRLQGGAWFLEVKLSKDRRRWHPHLHVVAAGSFIDAKTLSKAWLQVTGDSYITDIRAIGDVRKRAAYVTKYATKPLHNEVTLDPAKLDEFVVAIKGKRLYQCFGTWSKAVHRDAGRNTKLTRVAALSTLHRDAVGGCVRSLVLLHQVHARWPATRRSFPIPDAWHATPPPTTSDAAPPPRADE
jgi:hypothetical protein